MRCSRLLLVLLLALGVTLPSGGTATAATATATTSTTYRVVAGDTLSGIAARTGVPWQTLARYNRIRSPFVIRVGETLRLTPFDRAALVKRPEAATPPPPPGFAAALPAATSQVVRTVRSTRYCSLVYCTVTQAWSRDAAGRWSKVKEVRSTIGPNGFGKTRAGDGRSPSGVFAVPAVFSTTSTPATTTMPWKQRRPTSTVTGRSGYYYNTWIEEAGRTDGDRSSMRYGFLVGYNHLRVTPGVGPEPVQGKGSGIFYHTSTVGGSMWKATDGCTMLGQVEDMAWFAKWLDSRRAPRVVQDL